MYIRLKEILINWILHFLIFMILIEILKSVRSLEFRTSFIEVEKVFTLICLFANRALVQKQQNPTYLKLIYCYYYYIKIAVYDKIHSLPAIILHSCGFINLLKYYNLFYHYVLQYFLMHDLHNVRSVLYAVYYITS